MPSEPSPNPATLSLVISEVQPLTAQICRYRLRAVNETELPLIGAGAHLAVPVQLPDGTSASRLYSICSNPIQRDFYDIAVRRDADGRGGSQYIHQTFNTGMTLNCSMPSNHFQLHADAAPAILIAGGIGITPIKAIAHTLSLRGRRFNLHYAGRSIASMAFVAELQDLFPRHLQLYPSDQQQRVDLMQLMSDAPSNAHFYLCGPNTLLNEADICARLLGIDKDRIQYEHFAAERHSGDKPVVLELAYANKVLQVAADQPLLNALRDAGIKVNYDCCVGDCGSCAVQILEGTAEHRDHVLSDAAKAKGMICLCVSRATSEKLVLAL